MVNNVVNLLRQSKEPYQVSVEAAKDQRAGLLIRKGSNPPCPSQRVKINISDLTKRFSFLQAHQCEARRRLGAYTRIRWEPLHERLKCTKFGPR